MIFKPYPYQQAGIQWILDHPACGLFWGMGTGKTVTALLNRCFQSHEPFDDEIEEDDEGEQE